MKILYELKITEVTVKTDNSTTTESTGRGQIDSKVALSTQTRHFVPFELF